jgi:anti-anti-sigma factor
VDEYPFLVRGEVDVANADAVLGALRAHAAAQNGTLVVDCRHVEFLDASGLRAFVIADNELRRQQRRMLLVNPTPLLVRILDVCGLNELVIPSEEVSLA